MSKMKDIPISTRIWDEIRFTEIFDRQHHYHKKGYQCALCQDAEYDCFFPKPLMPGRPLIRACTNCARLKRGCHRRSAQQLSASLEPDSDLEENNNESRALHSKLAPEALQQKSKGNSSTNLKKRKARSPELEYVLSSPDSGPEYATIITPPLAPTSSSRVKFKTLPSHSTSSIPRKRVVRHFPIPSAFQLSPPSTSFTHTHTIPQGIHPEPKNPIPSSIQLSSSSSSFNPPRTNYNPELRPKVPRAPPNDPFPSSNQPSSSSILFSHAPNNPSHETQSQAPVHTAIRQMEHMNATIVALHEALEGEIREAEEADRTRRARIYRIESAMKMTNRDVRAANDVLLTLYANVQLSIEDHAQMDRELDRYRQMLAKLQDSRVHRDRAAQERQRREQEHRDLLDDELLGGLEKR